MVKKGRGYGDMVRGGSGEGGFLTNMSVQSKKN